MAARSRAAVVSGGGPTGEQLAGLRRRNAAAALGIVRTRGTVSRSEIAAAVGLSPTAVTNIAAELIEAGWITEIAAPVTMTRERGRPRRPVGLDRTRHHVLGVHIGLRRVSVGLVDITGEVRAMRSRSHASPRPRSVIAAARRLVAEVLDAEGVAARSVLAYGTCCGGWVSSEDGVVREFAGLGWHDVALADDLHLDGLPRPFVDSSVRALALAEAGVAVTDGMDNVLYLFVGNVIGCAHVQQGRIARGTREAAGTIDHLATAGRGGITCSCGRRDCLWSVASDAAVLAGAEARRLVPPGARIEDLVELSRGTAAGARPAARLLAERARRVGDTLSALLDLYDPDLVVVGGGLRLAEEHLPALVTAARERTVLPHDATEIRPATLVGSAALVRGAATPALEARYADPLGAAVTGGAAR